MASKDDLGRWGEQVAADHLTSLGYLVLDRNWRCGQGEIDIVARDGASTAVVEVKTRSSLAFGHPFEAITSRKLARLHGLAMAWCRAHPGRHGNVRVDVVGVVRDPAGAPQIELMRDVF
ncbi:MAG: YraN family protein [Naasia sp.]|jgi:putative endonuclease|uniref:YraN family protein n=1 Tax=Naasia sp. TaxID=2546198 RepID=UPI002610233C|nr:YraN family protein [Naasia sp.]MCU1571157.1 YraN family protein [Naasia sp.]